MKNFFCHVNNLDEVCKVPYSVIWNGKPCVCFINRFSVTVTTEEYRESAGSLPMLRPDLSGRAMGFFQCDGECEVVSIKRAISDVKSYGYRLGSGTTNFRKIDSKYALKYQNGFFSVALLDLAFRIINDGKDATVWCKGGNNPLVVRASVGICCVLPRWLGCGYAGKIITIGEVASDSAN